MSAFDRDKARELIHGYINLTLHNLPETRVAVEGTLDRLEECVRATPVLVYSEEDFRAKVDAEAKLARIAALCDAMDPAGLDETPIWPNDVRAILDGTDGAS